MNAKREALSCFVAALVLLVTALAIVFGLRPGGFETQVGWFYGLIPGQLPAQFIASKLALDEGELTRSAVFGVGLLLTLAWYCVLSFGLLRVWRRLTRGQGSADRWRPNQY